jgi:choline monooxygenase
VRADHSLPAVRHEIWQGFVFVNFDPHAPELAPQLADLTPLAEPYHFERMKAVLVRRATVPWNWKVSLENFTEAYHQPMIHPITADHDFPATKAVYADSTGPYSYFRLPQVHGERTQTVVPAVEGMPESYYRELAVINVYPLLHVFADAATPLWLDWNISGVNEHEMVWYMLVPEQHITEANTEQVKADFMSFIEPILLEDVEVCRSVGTGVRSSMAKPGRLSWMEKSVHQFQNWLLDQLQLV